MVIKVTGSTSKEDSLNTNNHDQLLLLRRKSATMAGRRKRPGSALEGETTKLFIVGPMSHGVPSQRVAHPQVTETSGLSRGADGPAEGTLFHR